MLSISVQQRTSIDDAVKICISIVEGHVEIYRFPSSNLILKRMAFVIVIALPELDLVTKIEKLLSLAKEHPLYEFKTRHSDVTLSANYTTTRQHLVDIYRLQKGLNEETPSSS